MEEILNYEWVVNSIISGRCSNYQDYEDLKQVGMMALSKAMINYDDSYNTKFSTYAYMYVKGEIRKYLEENKSLKIGRDLTSLSYKINLFVERFQQSMKRDPSLDEIAFGLEKDLSQIVLAIQSREAVLSSDYYANDQTDDKGMNLYDTVPYLEKSYDPEIQDLRNALAGLDENERRIIELRYFEDMTQSETSKIVGINQVGVSRMETKILKKLNNNLVA